MPKKYICELCDKIFKQKIDYKRHKNKKNACVSLEKIKKISNNQNNKIKNKQSLITIFKYCLDVLRDSEHLTGDKALRSLAHLLIIKLIEPKLESEIDIDNEEHYEDFEDDEEHEIFKKMLTQTRFSELIKVKENIICDVMQEIWNRILSKHPKTKDIYIEGGNFRIKSQKAMKKLLNKLSEFNIDDYNVDIQGEAYEEVIKDVMTGKILGQFFTPPEIKQFMVQLIDPQIYDDGTIETIFDPAMGTGGFLITSLRHILKQSKLTKVKLDWDFISNSGLGGREAEPDTYQLARANMLISAGQMFNSIECGDSIRDPIDRKYDIILTNPPFGIKGLDYDEIKHKLKNVYLPIKTNSAVPLFLQAIIHMLKINGRCAMVLPNGQELFSKNKALVNVRKYLMKTCNLKEVIYMPSGIFTHTSIKTCIFYFIKRKDCKDVLEVKEKISSKSKKIIGRIYNFKKNYRTKKVKFYDYNPYTKVKNELTYATIEELIENKFSLNYQEYMEESSEEETDDDDIEYQTLDEICNFEIGGTPARKNNKYYDNGKNLWISVRELNRGYIYDTKEKITDLGVLKSSVKLYKIGTILFSFKLSIGKTGIVGKPMYSNEAIAGINSKDQSILNNKYLYYYLTLTDFKKYGVGILGNGSMNKKSLAKIKIPIPSLEIQKHIVEQLNYIYEKCIKTSEEQIQQIKNLNKLCIKNQIKFGDNDIKTLGKICNVDNKLPKYITSHGKNKGKYNFHTGGVRTNLYIDEYDIKELHIIQNRTNGSGKCNIFIDKCFSLAKQALAYRANNDITTKYIYYYLDNNIKILEEGFIGANHKNISKEFIKKIKIQLPSNEQQKYIAEYCDFNNKQIEILNISIEKNKLLAKHILRYIN